MPITAKFSKDFYDKLGHEAVDELVAYLNAVDDAHRRDLREASDRSWERFEARLDQRSAELREAVATGLAAIRAQIQTDMDARLAATNAAVAQLRDALKDARADMIKWMFVFWTGATFTILGAVFAIVRL